MLTVGQQIDRYTVECHLGTGGMAVVYRVKHNQLDSHHALKVLSVTSPQIKHRLLQEGKVQAALQHRNIVAVTDVIDVDGAPGLVMEYIDGPALDEWLQTHEPEIEEAEALFRGIVSGVAAAHERGVIHRDLKPANVMLAGRDRVPKVADFGLAKAYVESRAGGMSETRSGITMGTPAYMAPEQIRDAKTVDQRADVFSLGCILFELMCGRPPFDGPDILHIFNAVASGSFPPPRSLVPDLPAHVVAAITGALAVERDDRIPDCKTLAAVLDGRDWLGSKPPAPTTFTNVPSAPDPEIRAAAAAAERSMGSGAGQAANVAPETFLTQEESDPIGSLAPTASLETRPSRSSLSASIAPKKRIALAGMFALFGVGAATIAVSVAGGLWLQRTWVETAHAAVQTQLGVDVAYETLTLRPQYVEAAGISIGDTLQADRVRVPGKWGLDGASLRFTPEAAEIEGVMLTPLSDGHRASLPASLSEALRRLPNTGLETIRVTDAQARIDHGRGPLSVGFDALSYTNLDDVWSVEGTGLSVDGLVSDGRVVVRPDGQVEVDALDVSLEVDAAGQFVVPSVLDDAVAFWFGGASPGTDLGTIPAALSAVLPVTPDRVSVRNGSVALIDRAHGVRAVRWELDISQLSLGPRSDGFLPFDGVANLGGARVSLEGDVDTDGLVRGRLSTRRLPLEPMVPYLYPAMEARRIELAGGLIDGNVRFTMQGDALATMTTLTVYDATLTGPGASSAPGADGPVDIEQEVVGSLAQADFHPIADLLDAVHVGLLGTAMASVIPEAAPSRPVRAAPTPAPLTDATPAEMAPDPASVQAAPVEGADDEAEPEETAEADTTDPDIEAMRAQFQERVRAQLQEDLATDEEQTP